jgi:hypothetical protein
MEIRMPLTLVTQANLTDCGLACTAIVARQKLETVLRIAIKECGYPKDGPHTTTDENLFKLLDHFGIKYGKKQKVKTVAELPDVAIMETRKMPSTGNSHLVVFERTADGAEHALDPGWWLKQQVRSDWNRIKLDTYIPIYLAEQPKSKRTKTGKEDATVSPSPKAAKASKPKKPKASAATLEMPASEDPPSAGTETAIQSTPENEVSGAVNNEWAEAPAPEAAAPATDTVVEASPSDEERDNAI